MNQRDSREATNPQPLIEDLTVNEDQAEEVKGGPVQGTWAVFWKGDRIDP